MKKFFKFIVGLLTLTLIFTLAACDNNTPSANDPYKNYTASGIEVKAIDIYKNNIFDSACEFARTKEAVLLTNYAEYSEYAFNLDYTESYFENNALLIFMTQSRSSDNMAFDKIMLNEGKLYPLYIRDNISSGQAVTDDVIILAYSAEIAKSDNYELGEIIYKYRDDYSLYRSYKGSTKGVEVYCWKKDNEWYSGLLLGTNRNKTVDEVQEIQNKLPCPIDEMKLILNGFDKDEIALISIVNFPADELNVVITQDNINEYKYVYEKLGIAFPYEQ